MKILQLIRSVTLCFILVSSLEGRVLTSRKIDNTTQFEDEFLDCTKPVDHNVLEKELSFLQGVINFEDLCFVAFPDGNYTGEVKNGSRHGWGEMKWKNGTQYGPDLIFYYSEGDTYLGEWVDGKQNGIGTFSSKTGVYVGDWKGGLQTGNGTAIYNNGNKYVGEFVNGFKEGHGKFEVSNGDVYTGNFQKGQRSGQGIEIFYTGERYVGQYKNDLQNGIGTAYYANGAVKYVGDWQGGSPHGNGTYLALNGDRYEGHFKNGVITGPGTIHETNGNIRFLQNNQGIEFRGPSNKYSKLLEAIGNFLGLHELFKKVKLYLYDVVETYLN